MVKSLELVQTRVISGKGILIIPEEYRTARDFVLVLDILRLPSQQYLNFAYNPPKGGFGLLTFNRNGRTLFSEQMIFDPQEWDYQNDPSGQTLIAIKCAYSGILDTFVNLGNALALSSISVTNNTTEMSFSQTIWDTVKAKCYADTQIKLRLYARQWDECGEEPIKFSPPLPPDDNPPTKKPPGTPATDNSPPYNSETNDNGDTSYNPIDTTAPCVSVVRGAGLNNQNCGPLDNFADRSYNGYAELVPVTVPPFGCAGLRLFLNGVDQGLEQTFHTTAIILSRSGNCVAP